MGTWKFKNEVAVMGHLNSPDPAPLGCYKHTDGRLYYLCTYAYTTYLRRNNMIGEDINLIEPFVRNSQSGYDCVAVPYHNDTSGYDEVHFVLGRDNANGIDNYTNTKLIFSSTPTTSTFTSGNLRAATIWNDNMAYPTSLNSTKAVWVNGVLYYVHLPSNTLYDTVYTIQRYDPSTQSWVDVITEGSLSTPIYHNKFTVFSVGYKIYILGTSADGGMSPMIITFNTTDNSKTVIAGNNLQRNRATPLAIGNNVYLLGGETYRYNDNTPATTVVKYNVASNIWEDTMITNTINFATTANALNTGGEMLFCGSFTGANSNAVTKYTYVLDDIVDFTASYQPKPPTVTLTWQDNSEESFYVIEKKVNNGEWVLESNENANETSYVVTGVDLINNTYSFRIRAGKIVVS
jgi:hypothetical protein